MVSPTEFGEPWLLSMNSLHPLETPALLLAAEWRKGIEAAERIARANRMERAFTIAPTATRSYNYTDLRGNTTCPEIALPSTVKLIGLVPPLVRRQSPTATWRLHLKSAMTRS